MKNLLLIPIFFFCKITIGQIPEVNYKDLGFTQKIKKVESYTYSLDDKWVTDKSSDVYEFDEKGNITHHEFLIYGKYASATSENSTYENGLLVKREILVKNRPNFNAVITYKYDKKKNLIQKKYKSNQYENDFIFSYNSNNKLAEIKGIYANNYAVEKFYYDKGKLIKSINQYFEKDSVLSETITLYIDEKKVIECNPKNEYLIAYLNEETENTVLKMNYPNPIENSNGIESEIQYDGLTIKQLKENLFSKINQQYRLVEAKEIQQLNDQNDWVVRAGTYYRYKEQENYYTFRKITYADGTTSGSIDFDILKVNEMNTKLHD